MTVAGNTNDVTDFTIIDPAFLGRDARNKVKARYGLDFFIAHRIEIESGEPFPKFFQINRDGRPKGIIVVDLGG